MALKQGDWLCAKCYFHNYARFRTCSNPDRTCNEPKDWGDCRFFKKSGYCNKGYDCMFNHMYVHSDDRTGASSGSRSHRSRSRSSRRAQDRRPYSPVRSMVGARLLDRPPAAFSSPAHARAHARMAEPCSESDLEVDMVPLPKSRPTSKVPLSPTGQLQPTSPYTGQNAAVPKSMVRSIEQGKRTVFWTEV